MDNEPSIIVKSREYQNILLLVTVFSGSGKIQIEFPFDLVNDSTDSVFAELVESAQIQDNFGLKDKMRDLIEEEKRLFYGSLYASETTEIMNFEDTQMYKELRKRQEAELEELEKKQEKELNEFDCTPRYTTQSVNGPAKSQATTSTADLHEGIGQRSGRLASSNQLFEFLYTGK